MFHVFQYLIAYYVVKLLVFEGQFFSIGMYKGLMRVYFHVTAAVVIGVNKFFGYHVGAICRIMARTYLQHFVVFIYMDVSSVVGGICFHCSVPFNKLLNS